jgi:hypothetical protein
MPPTTGPAPHVAEPAMPHIRGSVGREAKCWVLYGPSIALA